MDGDYNNYNGGVVDEVNCVTVTFCIAVLHETVDTGNTEPIYRQN
jgi:hypothetical protein